MLTIIHRQLHSKVKGIQCGQHPGAVVANRHIVLSPTVGRGQAASAPQRSVVAVRQILAEKEHLGGCGKERACLRGLRWGGQCIDRSFAFRAPNTARHHHSMLPLRPSRASNLCPSCKGTADYSPARPPPLASSQPQGSRCARPQTPAGCAPCPARAGGTRNIRVKRRQTTRHARHPAAHIPHSAAALVCPIASCPMMCSAWQVPISTPAPP